MSSKKLSPQNTDPAPSAPTLEDVARHAGVSTATVSRTLNLPDQVSSKTKERVFDAINALGYAPNFGARVMAAKRTNTFGAIVPTLESAIFARGLQAFQEELGRHGITLLVASSSYSPELEEAQIQALIARGADALLLIGHDRTAQSYDFLAQRNVPYVVAWSHDPSQAHPSIGFDNQSAMSGLAARVFELGHRSVGMISAPREGNDRAEARYRGVCAAMSAHGLDPNDLSVIETPYSISGGAQAFCELMRQSSRPTAVLCGNDVLAAGALSMARTLGIRVPDEVSVTGFDDIEIAEIVTPALTTVRVPHGDMGTGAANMLVEMRNGATDRKITVLDATLVFRDSLARAASV